MYRLMLSQRKVYNLGELTFPRPLLSALSGFPHRGRGESELSAACGGTSEVKDQ